MSHKQYATDVKWAEADLKLRYALWEQFRSCQAYVYFDSDNTLWIKSYNTVVALITRDGTLKIRGHYSRTTSAQITKIYRSYKDGKLVR